MSKETRQNSSSRSIDGVTNNVLLSAHQKSSGTAEEDQLSPVLSDGNSPHGSDEAILQGQDVEKGEHEGTQDMMNDLLYATKLSFYKELFVSVYRSIVY